MRKKLVVRLILMDLAVVVGSLAFLWLTRLISGDDDTCGLHRILHLYCPACGGTRAVKALFGGKFLTALSLFPPVYVALAIAIELHVRAVVAYKREDFFPITHYPKNRWVILGISVALWFFVRNLLLIVWKIDLSGDFLPR